MKNIILSVGMFIAMGATITMAAPAQKDFTPPGIHTQSMSNCSKIADKIGRAGMIAVPLAMEYGGAQILMTGGANFPLAKRVVKVPADRGPKVFYEDVRLMSPVLGGSSAIGNMPYSVGYAAYASFGKDVIIAGGCNEDGHLNRVVKLSVNRRGMQVKELPSMPVHVAYPAFAQVEGKLYVFGGQEHAHSVKCMNRSWVWEEGSWKELAPMPEASMLAVAGVIQGKIYVAGGCSLKPDGKGNAKRTYLKSTWCYDPQTNTWTRMADMPETIVGAAGPMPEHDGNLFLIGGDPGNYYRASLAGKAPKVHPGQSKAVYAYNPEANAWKRAGLNTLGVATVPAVKIGRHIYCVSGETAPGVRTPVISTITFK